jgi:hypothetical protein
MVFRSNKSLQPLSLKEKAVKHAKEFRKGVLDTMRRVRHAISLGEESRFVPGCGLDRSLGRLISDVKRNLEAKTSPDSSLRPTNPAEADQTPW